MKRTMMRLLALLLMVGVAACRTDIALVDDTFGHEHIHAGRFAHVRTARAPLALRGDGREVRFVLDVAIENDRDEPWVVEARAFGVAAERDQSVCTTLRLDLPEKAVLATVPARSDLDVRLPLLLLLADGKTVYDVEDVPIVLTLDEGDRELLHRRIVVGTYSQTGQIIRVFALATGGLLLLSLL